MVCNEPRFNLKFAKNLKSPHSSISSLKSKLKEEKLDYFFKREGLVHGGNNQFSVSISPQSIERGVSFLDALIRNLEVFGHDIVINEYGSSIMMYGLKVPIRLREKRTIKDPDPKKQYSPREYECTGLLGIQLEERYRKKEWYATSNSPIEERIGWFVAKIESFGRENRRYQDMLEKGWEEQRIRQEESNKKQQEIEEEKLKVEQLIIRAEKFQKAQKIIDYVNNVNLADEYREWALNYANSLIIS
jgi:hypothetical protein